MTTCRAFFRSTGVNENTFRQRMGKDWTVFSRSLSESWARDYEVSEPSGTP